MVWPFSSRASRDSAAGSDPPAGRRGEAKDPEAQLRAQTRRRLIGASALLFAAVIIVPMLLDRAPRPLPDNVSITVTTSAPATGSRRAAEPKVAEPAPAEAEPAPPPAEAPIHPVEPAAKPDASSKAAAPAATPEPKAREAAAAAAPFRPAAPAAKAGAAAAPPAPTAATPATAETGRFLVQVAAFANPAAAEELLIVLLKEGYKAYVAQVQTVNGTVHRVRVGPFSSRDEAQRTIERLRAADHKATLVGG